MSEGGVTLGRVIDALERAGVEHMVVGSFASTFHGTPRTTRDIDIVVRASADQVRSFVKGLPESKWYADSSAAVEAHTRSSMFNVIDLENGWKVDLIFLKPDAFAESEFSRRQAVELLVGWWPGKQADANQDCRAGQEQEDREVQEVDVGEVEQRPAQAVLVDLCDEASCAQYKA